MTNLKTENKFFKKNLAKIICYRIRQSETDVYF